MPVQIYSKRLDSKKKLSANFSAGEFACADGSDEIRIDEALVENLQKIRDHFGQPVTINSSYRTAAHNKKIGGSPNSQHMLGTAADIVVKGVTPLTVAQYAEALGMGGIGHYPTGQGNFTHVDTRAGKSRWEKRNGKEVTVTGFGGKPFDQQMQNAAGLDINTMAYLSGYRYAAALMYKLAEAIYKKAAKGSGESAAALVQKFAGLDERTMDYLRDYKYGRELLEKLAAAMK